MVRSAIRAKRRRIRRSASTIRSIPGRRTLTMTSRPSSKVAAWTWAMDPAAIAFSSKLLKQLSIDPPMASSISGRMVWKGSGGTRSCRLVSASIHSGSSRSLRIARIWPNLTATGPMSRNSATTASGRALSSVSSPPLPRPSLADSPFRPCRPNRTRICANRSRSFNAATSEPSFSTGSAMVLLS